ncbi:cupin [Jeotgalibacillus sp. R-1-5s-1]|uniref:cupin domain-containing protein n=1 Tax=Jeotgalibacillus sp. R-1-5s-1 TaxID=2555897 RepID=UPI00106B0055|nr:cupin [Jeotgalibacillus sp. R-1-5s-1]TFD99893.1 cupin [Jeotgalibacillus sp. R-1-5s-1]
MKLYQLSKEKGRSIEAYDSNFILTSILRTNDPVQISMMHLDRGGVIGYHQASMPQLLVVVSGQGEVRGAEHTYVDISINEAVFWEKGEWHETRSEEGLTAIVIEGPMLDVTALREEKYD